MRGWRAVVAALGAAAVTCALALAIASMLDPSRLVAACAAAALLGAAHAVAWPYALTRAAPDRAAVARGAITASFVVLVLARIPPELLAFDRFGGGPAIGMAVVVLPLAAAVAALAGFAPRRVC